MLHCILFTLYCCLYIPIIQHYIPSSDYKAAHSPVEKRSVQDSNVPSSNPARSAVNFHHSVALKKLLVTTNKVTYILYQTTLTASSLSSNNPMTFTCPNIRWLSLYH